MCKITSCLSSPPKPLQYHSSLFNIPFRLTCIKLLCNLFNILYVEVSMPKCPHLLHHEIILKSYIVLVMQSNLMDMQFVVRLEFSLIISHV